MKLIFVIAVLILLGIPDLSLGQQQGPRTVSDYTTVFRNARSKLQRKSEFQNRTFDQTDEETRMLYGYFQELQATMAYFNSPGNTQHFRKILKDKALPISNKCENQLKEFVAGLESKKHWALSMLDALGKVPAGLLEGNKFWTGSYDQCLATTYADTKETISGRYCRVFLPLPIKRDPAVFIGLCVPDGCTEEDLEHTVASLLHINGSLPTPYPGLQFVDCEPQQVELDWRAKVAIVVCSIIGGLVALGTTYDIVRNMLSAKNTDENGNHSTTRAANGYTNVYNEHTGVKPQLSVGEYTPLLGAVNDSKTAVADDKPGKLGQVLLAFSAYSNGRRLLATGSHQEGTLPAIHGVRFLSMCWVIMGHCYLFVMEQSANASVISDWVKRFTFQLIDNAFFAVDSFFVLSGLLLVYLIMREREKKGRVNWVMFYVHRFWRLTPAYMLVLMVDTCLFRYFADGPMWNKEKGFEVDFCKDTWWQNLLYINNLFDLSKLCMGWSWYLAVDMQLFVISPIILIPLFYSKIIGGILMGLLILTHILTNAIITHHYDLGTGGITDAKENQFSEYLYFKPYSRVGPYVIGMITGYLLYVCKGKFRAHKGLIAVMWVCAAVLSIVSVYGLVGTYNEYPLPSIWKDIYNAFSRLSWSVALGWVIFACSTGNGGFINTLLSWKAIVPLSRLTYCTYLVHILVIYLFVNTLRTPFYMTDLSMTCAIIGHLVGSFAVAFVTSLCFESPMMGLEKVLWRH